MPTVLHFSPVRKPAPIVALHLESLKNLNQNGIDLTFSFFDDNTDKMSSDLIRGFVASTTNSFLFDLDVSETTNYKGEERWVPDLYQRITVIKNKVIDFFLKSSYDFLFLTDADLMVHPQTLGNLVVQKKDFCSTIFWTRFKGTDVFTPNCWYSKPNGFSKDDLLNFRGKSTLAVDFTGACTLLSRKILNDRVSFEKIHNIPYLGEDKHFCIRAAVLGYQAYVNTEYPAFHVYDQTYIDRGKELLKNGFDNSYLGEWLNEDWERKINLWLHPPRKSFIQKVISKFKK